MQMEELEAARNGKSSEYTAIHDLDAQNKLLKEKQAMQQSSRVSDLDEKDDYGHQVQPESEGLHEIIRENETIQEEDEDEEQEAHVQEWLDDVQQTQTGAVTNDKDGKKESSDEEDNMVFPSHPTQDRRSTSNPDSQTGCMYQPSFSDSFS